VNLGAITTAGVLSLLEPIQLIVVKVVIERITVVKSRMNDEGGTL